MRVSCAGKNGRLAFEHPETIVEAWHAEDVPAAFARIEAALDAGCYVAGFFSYDLGAALVPRQTIVPATQLPYLSLGVFASAGTERLVAAGDARPGPLYPHHARSRYAADVATIARAIGDGDVYQVNYAMPFGFAFDGDPFALYSELARGGAYPYAAFVERDAYALVSCSPELFIERSAHRIVTKPMKGTARLDRAEELQQAKNRAEHVMIVDLLRNDLHRLSTAVAVEKLADVETYPGYVTLTSTIAADAGPEVTLADTLEAMFPCGSVTGAPKVAAMQIIAETENRARGIFCGSIGYLAPDRSGIWNVAIRTATIDRTVGRGVLEVGGGIVADSDVRSEWAEILTKRTFFAALTPDYALLETILREADGTFAYLEPHLARLARAADDLHFDYDASAVRMALTNEPAGTRSIVRLELRRDGTFAIMRRSAAHAGEPVDICWSDVVLDAREPLLRYKTTWRPHYDAALETARLHGCFDAILCNRRGEVADGARTSIFISREGRDAHLATPPLTAGALPGILRSRLIASGAAREAVLTRADIASASGVYIGNSVRGLIRARLIERPASNARRGAALHQ